MKKAFELGFYVTFGAGIAFGISSFTILSELFKVASSFWLVISICLAGVVCMLLSSAIAELASMYPSAPGVRTYLKVALPPRTSLFLVYLYLIFMIMVAGIDLQWSVLFCPSCHRPYGTPAGSMQNHRTQDTG